MKKSWVFLLPVCLGLITFNAHALDSALLVGKTWNCVTKSVSFYDKNQKVSFDGKGQITYQKDGTYQDNWTSTIKHPSYPKEAIVSGSGSGLWKLKGDLLFTLKKTSKTVAKNDSPLAKMLAEAQTKLAALNNKDDETFDNWWEDEPGKPISKLTAKEMIIKTVDEKGESLTECTAQ